MDSKLAYQVRVIVYKILVTGEEPPERYKPVRPRRAHLSILLPARAV